MVRRAGSSARKVARSGVQQGRLVHELPDDAEPESPFALLAADRQHPHARLPAERVVDERGLADALGPFDHGPPGGSCACRAQFRAQ
ncbi:hypothetical protein BKM31_23700 [[Actinomadura] parvosata subsp. kistnae]|uniref:Uncharacterized protein n=1 Tax=[Actinomadura] parvosata subsp. kistnae TaxID=1909395 RepID=A0A1V0A1K3_9ACTN|nr:hypothetical protein BKM31_23700 [Nonomuraea sp. ATCC 55076]